MVAPNPGAPAVRLIEWHTHRSGALRGYVSVVVGRAMRINGINVMAGETGGWLRMPSRPMIANGQPMCDRTGRPKYTPIVEWTDRPAERRFCAAVLAALLAEYPDALG